MTKKMIALMVAVLFAGTSLMVPAIASAETCRQCCDRIDEIVANYPQPTPEMLITKDPGTGDIWGCLMLGIGCAGTCCAILDDCQDITAAMICFVVFLRCFEECIANTAASLKADCSCCGGCP